MEIVVNKSELLRELQFFQGIVERKNTIPILANVLMDAQGDFVSFLATDLEVGLRSRCEAKVTKSGSLTLPAKKFYEIVKSLPDTDIRIADDKSGVKISTVRNIWQGRVGDPSYSTLSAIARALEVSIEDLADESGSDGVQSNKTRSLHAVPA